MQFYAKIIQPDAYIENFSCYLIELALVEYKLIKYSPSLISLASLYLAMKICKKEELSGHLVDMRERTRHSEA